MHCNSHIKFQFWTCKCSDLKMETLALSRFPLTSAHSSGITSRHRTASKSTFSHFASSSAARFPIIKCAAISAPPSLGTLSLRFARACFDLMIRPSVVLKSCGFCSRPFGEIQGGCAAREFDSSLQVNFLWSLDSGACLPMFGEGRWQGCAQLLVRVCGAWSWCFCCRKFPLVSLLILWENAGW